MKKTKTARKNLQMITKPIFAIMALSLKITLKLKVINIRHHQMKNKKNLYS
jgi:hypothetical protein